MDDFFLINIVEDEKCLIIKFDKLRDKYPQSISGEVCSSLLNDVFKKVNIILESRKTFTVYLFLEGMKLKDIQDLHEFIVNMITLFNNFYTGKLNKCYVMNSPSYFENILHIIRSIAGKEARSKLIII
jgi:hypothetical protein